MLMNFLNDHTCQTSERGIGFVSSPTFWDSNGKYCQIVSVDGIIHCGDDRFTLSV